MFWRAILLVAVTLATASAQGGMGGGGAEGMGGGGGGGRRGMSGAEGAGGGVRPQRKTQFEEFADKLKLNKDQKTEAGTILQDTSKQMLPVQEKLQHVRQDLAGALIDGQTGQPVDGLLKTYAQLAAQVSGMEANAFAKICKMLKPNQRKNAPQAFQVIAEIFDPPGPSGARAGRGGRSER